MLIVHFRNVSAPGRYFEETLLEDGYMNMYDAMKQLVRCDYDGLIHVDHVSEYVASCGGKNSAMAYSTGYMKGLLHCALQEVNSRKVLLESIVFMENPCIMGFRVARLCTENEEEV